MHDKHLGTDKVAYGSTIHRLIRVLMPFGVDENLRVLLHDIHDGYLFWDVDTQSRFSSIRMSMISKSGAVKLKGKAAEVRRLCHPLHDAFKKYS